MRRKRVTVDWFERLVMDVEDAVEKGETGRLTVNLEKRFHHGEKDLVLTVETDRFKRVYRDRVREDGQSVLETLFDGLEALGLQFVDSLDDAVYYSDAKPSLKVMRWDFRFKRKHL